MCERETLHSHAHLGKNLSIENRNSRPLLFISSRSVTSSQDAGSSSARLFVCIITWKDSISRCSYAILKCATRAKTAEVKGAPSGIIIASTNAQKSRNHRRNKQQLNKNICLTQQTRELTVGIYATN
jgi:hypothetical protein